MESYWGVKTIVQNNNSSYEDIFFDRPVGPLRRKNIGVLVGKHTSLHEIATVHSIITAMNHMPVLIADEVFKSQNIPANVFLHSEDKLHYENTDEALVSLDDCHIIIAGIGLELTSAMQLFLERVLQTSQAPTVLTESVLTFPTLDKYLNQKTLLFASTRGLLKLISHKKTHESGLNRKIVLLGSLSTICQVACIEKHQLLGLSTRSNKVGIVNSKERIDINALLSIFVGLLADRGEPLAPGWLQYLLASGYLYKEVYLLSSNPVEALQTYFDFN